MRLTNTTRNWGAIAKLFHWVVALAVIANLGLGYWADGLDPSATKAQAFYWHKTVGLTVLWLVALRLLWRLINPTPRLPATTPSWQRWMARISHFLLYVALVAMPVSGWLMHAAGDEALVLYGLYPVPETIPGGLAESRVGDLANLIHYWTFVALCILIALHVLGALKHHLINDEPVLRRMLPLSRATDPIRGE